MKTDADPMDVRTKSFLVGAVVGLVLMAALAASGIRDARMLSTGMLLATIGPVYLTVTRLRTYLPRVQSVWRRELLNVPIGVALGVAISRVWKLFPTMYRGLEEIAWPPGELAGGAYVEGVQIAFNTAGGYLLALLLGGTLVAVQAALWVVPAYFVAKWITKPMEDQVERLYRQKVLRDTRQIVGRRSRVTKLAFGGELAETRLELRLFGLMLSLFAGLATMFLLAWSTAPFARWALPGA